jgi:outer membrane protein TolC
MRPKRRFLTCLIAAALAAASLAPPAAAQSSLSLAQAQRAAVERSRGLDGRRLAASAARDMAAAAGRLPDPVLTFGLDNVPAQGPDRYSLSADPMTMKRVAVMQEITASDKRGLRAQRFESEARREQAEQEALTAAIQRDTALAWLDARYADEMTTVVAEQRSRAVEETQAAEGAYRAGRGSQADVLMAHAGVAMLDDRAAELQRKARSARTMLARWIGEGADRALEPKPQIGSLSVGLHDAELSGHPQIEALARAEEVANAEARLAAANRNPDWSVEVAWQERPARYGDMFSVSVSIPLAWDRVNRQDRETSAKLALAEQARAARDEALRQHSAEVQAMLQEWESNRSRLARYEREIVPLAAARTEATVGAYRGGKSSQAEVIAARRAELDARLQAVALESETARLWAQLTYLIPENTK